MLLILDDGTNEIFRVQSPVDVTASIANTYSALIPGGIITGVLGAQILGLSARIMLPAGFRILTSTTNLEAGDNYGPPRIWIEEWIQD